MAGTLQRMAADRYQWRPPRQFPSRSSNLFNCVSPLHLKRIATTMFGRRARCFELSKRVKSLLQRGFSVGIRNPAESVTFNLSEYKLYMLDNGPPKQTVCNKEEAKNYIEQMVRIRQMENACSNLYKERKVRGFCHLYAGQEAVGVGVEAGLKPGDAMITSYRCHGLMVTRGASVLSVISELTGRTTGASMGKGGSMHMYYKDFYGGNGIVGAQVPLGAGVALAMKYRKQANVCVDMYGDGAANQGQVFEAFNLAKLWKLPVIFLCENNKYGMGTADCRSSACIDYYTRASYIPGLWVNGMDVLAVREAIRFCRNWIMAGNGPIVFEAETYRYFGHSMSDPGTSYRTRDEIDLVRKQRDPINLFSQSVISAGLLTDAEVKEINAVVKKEVAQDRDQAETTPEPDVKLAYEHVHKQPIPGSPIRGCDILEMH
ncbi:hypothetical protein CRM22_000483 [Opisthorchis felineus]|uniref:Pyruvate dehydrogenase E1 component subunit alpha n=1 Tax=Opisthorchis felineus TaxID=147828 RepID=A0A4S2MJD2_OPIFE|nr:hypothetical protein CRM22_000483 [Opisthorchis felineus]